VPNQRPFFVLFFDFLSIMISIIHLQLNVACVAVFIVLLELQFQVPNELLLFVEPLLERLDPLSLPLKLSCDSLDLLHSLVLIN
jgi:hypothetical protein